MGGWLPQALVLRRESLAHGHMLLRPQQKQTRELRSEFIKCPDSRIDADRQSWIRLSQVPVGSHDIRKHMRPENKRVEKVTVQTGVLAFADAKLYCQLLQKCSQDSSQRT